MRAWQVTELGEPKDVLTEVDAEMPEIHGAQLRVRTLAAAANFPDVLMCRGMYQVRPPLPFTPGVEGCFEVVEVGPNVTEWAVGDRVIGGPVLPHGAFAEYAVLDASGTFAAPEALTHEEAAALFIGYQTGWFALHRRARIQEGETLLIHAAAGGVGSAAIQLGKAAGARVIGVVGGADKAEYATALGADIVIDRHTQDFVEVVKEATHGRGADVIFDPVGGETYQRSTKCIAFEGRILVIGFAGGDIQQAALNHALVKNYSILGLHWGLYAHHDPAAVRACHDELTRLANEGIVKPLIGEARGLDEVPAGVQALADGKTVGRVVFSPAATN
ncbi:MAG TPA: NADPH:quinone oxidoreductase family protein [Intrasporangiaceae bacterium]|nr:NADPH:quinone oxidoreductase family protein [Intrasporangiaceae bacterium]